MSQVAPWPVCHIQTRRAELTVFPLHSLLCGSPPSLLQLPFVPPQTTRDRAALSHSRLTAAILCL